MSAASLALLTLYVAALGGAAIAGGRTFAGVEPWPLGGGPGSTGALARGASMLLASALGWGVPGLSLALLTDRSLRGPALLGRALGLGTGYVLTTGLVHAVVAGHAPGRPDLLVYLAVPPLILFHRRRARDSAHAGTERTVIAAVGLMALLTLVLWPKLTREALNGDGTEAYELARSLEAHRLPHWDLERWAGPGRFGIPAVNPFLTNSYLGSGTMALIGSAEAAVRLPFVSSLVLAAILVVGLGGRPSFSGVLYLTAVAALYALWNAYYGGYEPAFTDLAEPAATDTLMTALLLAGLLEVAAGAAGFGVAFLLLASGVLYSAPLIATSALVFLWWVGAPAGARALVAWIAVVAIAVTAGAVVGAATGDLGDWVRQVESEYVGDFVARKRTPVLPLLTKILLLTGGLPLAALFHARRLSKTVQAPLVAGLVYSGIVLLSSYKNLHYLAPVPFLLAPAAIEASSSSFRVAAAAVAGLGLVLSWPGVRTIHRENVELGGRSCIVGLRSEEAALTGDVAYEAFSPPGDVGRFGVGKHTFVRYALDLGGTQAGCEYALGPTPPEGMIAVAGNPASFWVRDPGRYAFWRFRQPPVPSSWLFPRTTPPPLSRDPSRWSGRLRLSSGPGRALVISGFDPEPVTRDGRGRETLRMRERGRLLVPISRSGRGLVLGTDTDTPGLVVRAQVNGRMVPDVAVPSGGGGIAVPSSEPPWRPGWNVLELQAEAGTLGLVWLEIPSRP